MASGVTAIAYETITAADGSLPLLAPMSEIAGRMSISVAASVPDEGARRGGAAARRRARGAARAGGGAGWRCSRQPCGAHGAGGWRRCHRGRPFVAAPAPARRRVRQSAAHRILHPRRRRAPRARSRGGDRLGTDPRRSRAAAGDARHGGGHATRGGAGRHRHRPGRLLRDEPADQPRCADLRRARRRALLRDQHARRGAAHLHRGAHACHAAVHQARWPMRAWRARCRPIRISAVGSMSPMARSAANRSPARSACRCDPDLKLSCGVRIGENRAPAAEG